MCLKPLSCPRFAIAFWLCFLFFSPCFSQSLFLDLNQNGETLQTVINDLPYLVNESNNNNPYYSVFYMLETGYYENIKIYMPKNGGNSFQYLFPPYTFCTSGNFNGMALLTDRYIDPPPPPPNLVAGPVNSGNTGLLSMSNCPTMNTFISSPGDVIRIDTNHQLLDGKKHMYAISYKPDAIGRVHFFYNSKVSAQGTYSPLEAVINEQEFIPHYANGASFSNAKDFDDINNNNFPSQISFENHFSNVITYDNSQNEIDNTSKYIESRLFYYFDANSANLIKDNFAFLAVYTSNGQEPKDYVDTVGFSILSMATSGSMTIYGEHIIDYDYIEQEVLLPGDPNELDLEEVCYCCENPDGPYRFQFRFQFCNEGPGIAKKAKIEFEDKYGDFDCVEIVESTPSINITNNTPFAQAWTWTIDGLNLSPLNSTYNFDQSCVEVFFHAVTNDQGSDKISNYDENKEPLAIDVCNTFNDVDTTKDCKTWESDPDIGPKECEDKCPCVFCLPPDWVITTVIVILATFLFFMFRRRL